MVIKCVLYVESAYPHFVMSGLCWPKACQDSWADLPENGHKWYFCCCPVTETNPKIAFRIYTRKVCFSLNHFSFLFWEQKRNLLPPLYITCVCLISGNDTPVTRRPICFTRNNSYLLAVQQFMLGISFSCVGLDLRVFKITDHHLCDNSKLKGFVAMALSMWKIWVQSGFNVPQSQIQNVV